MIDRVRATTEDQTRSGLADQIPSKRIRIRPGFDMECFGNGFDARSALISQPVIIINLIAEIAHDGLCKLQTYMPR